MSSAPSPGSQHSRSSSQSENAELSYPDPKHPYDSTFWERTPEAAYRRKIYFRVFFSGLLVTIFFMYTIFSIYWGALYKTPVKNLDGWVVDFDGEQIGQVVTQGLTGFASTIGKVTWTAKPATDFPDGTSDLEYAIKDNRVWAIVAINSNATATLVAATTTADASYNSSLAISAYGNEARSENAFRAFIRPSIDASLTIISQRFTTQFVSNLASNDTLQRVAQNAPTLVSSPISYTMNNLVPFDIPLATAVTFVGLIFLLILSFFIVMMGTGAIRAAHFNHHLSLLSIVGLRLGSAVSMFFFVSLFYSSISAAFQVPFDRHFGSAGFVIFWMLNWVGMCAVGLALEAMLTLLTMRLMPYFMLLWVVSNISVCFFPIEVLPSIFRYGYAFPFYNISQGIRCIVFGTKNTLGLNFGILIAWSVLSCLTTPFFQWISRKLRTMRHRKAQSAQREHEKTRASAGIA